MAGERHHTFISYSRADQPAVVELAERLREEGLDPWLDQWNLVPGERWQDGIETALRESESCTVVIGPSGMGPWQHEEMRAAINRRVTQEEFRVIPLLLPGSREPTWISPSRRCHC